MKKLEGLNSSKFEALNKGAMNKITGGAPIEETGDATFGIAFGQPAIDLARWLHVPSAQLDIFVEAGSGGGAK